MTTSQLRNSVNLWPLRHDFFLILLVLVGFALSPGVQAVVPAPDGGYPNFTTAEGDLALNSLTTGLANTAVGWFSLSSATTGSFNTGVGAGALDVNNGNENTATGTGALLLNTSGAKNTANGAFALIFNNTGTDNTAMGDRALENNTEFGNTAVGSQALLSNTTGLQNTANGFDALASNITGLNNTANGALALASNTTGLNNTALGIVAGSNVTTANNVICIGASGANVSNSCYIGSIAGQTVGAGGSTCYVDNDGKLGVFLSALRFKTDIADMGAASEALLALRPVTFHYKPELDKTGIPQFGLVAEEVAKVDPDLVTHDAKGELSTVRYEAVNAMLLNEFLKQHRKVEEQEATIAQLKQDFQSKLAKQQEQIKVLTSGLGKVVNELEANRSAPRIVSDE